MSSYTYAVLPVKRFSLAKQRLGHEVEHDLHSQLVQSMVHDVIQQIAAAKLDGRIIVTCEPSIQAIASKYRFTVVHEPRLLGHSIAAQTGVDKAVAAGAQKVLLLSGDCPLVTAAAINDLLQTATQDVTILTDRRKTGTNALLLQPPTAITPAFGAGSRNRHIELAKQANRSFHVIDNDPSFALDIDHKSDLQLLRNQLTIAPATIAPATRTVVTAKTTG